MSLIIDAALVLAMCALAPHAVGRMPDPTAPGAGLGAGW
jgi:hypothetical protein